ncbi:MAG: hypothetical protein ACREBJ_07310, partial [Nitrosotalea sp.]
LVLGHMTYNHIIRTCPLLTEKSLRKKLDTMRTQEEIEELEKTVLRDAPIHYSVIMSIQRTEYLKLLHKDKCNQCRIIEKIAVQTGLPVIVDYKLGHPIGIFIEDREPTTIITI